MIWLEIFLVFDKSDQHTTIFDSYIDELASTILERAKVENITNKGFLIAPLTDYTHYEIFPELPTKEKCFNMADERVFIDVRDSKGYTGELKRLRRGDSNFVLHLPTKIATAKTLSRRTSSHPHR